MATAGELAEFDQWLPEARKTNDALVATWEASRAAGGSVAEVMPTMAQYFHGLRESHDLAVICASLVWYIAEGKDAGPG